MATDGMGVGLSGGHFCGDGVRGIDDAEGVGNDRSKSCHDQNQSQISEHVKELLGAGADAGGDDLTNGLTLVADQRRTERAKVMDRRRRRCRRSGPTA